MASDFIDTLWDLHRTRQSGVLRSEKGTAKKQIVLRLGQVACAESNLPEEHLARVLLQMKLLARTDFEPITEQIKNGKSIDEAILAASKLERAQLEQGARVQAISILASLFGRDDGVLHFYAGDGLVRRQIDLQMHTPDALLAAARQAAAEQFVPNIVTDLNALLVRPGSGERRDWPLDSAEAFTYALTSEPISAADLKRLIPPGPVKAEELIQRLFLLRLIGIERPGADNSARPGGPAQELLEVDSLLSRFEVSNFYEILGVPPDAKEDQIKTAYHELAKRYHPDRFQSRQYAPGLQAKFEKLFTYITGAYATLGTNASRQLYDETRLTKESQVEATLQAKSNIDAEKEKMAEALFLAGRAALSQKEYEKAAGLFKECLWLRPEQATFYHFLGTAQSEVPKFRKEAERNLKKALELNNASVSSYLALGKLYLKVNLPRRAEQQFQEALRWDPTNRVALGLLEKLSR